MVESPWHGMGFTDRGRPLEEASSIFRGSSSPSRLSGFPRLRLWNRGPHKQKTLDETISMEAASMRLWIICAGLSLTEIQNLSLLAAITCN